MRRAFLVLAALAAASCGGGDESKPKGPDEDGEAGPTKRGTLVFARGADSSFLDPAVVTDGESVKVTTNIFDALVAFKPGTAEPVPGLADQWSTSADGRSWKFHLREAKFHDGTQVDADAVAFSLLRQKDENHPAHGKNDVFSAWGDVFGLVTDVVVLDPRTVEIRLAEPFAPFLATMTVFSTAIQSPTAWKSEGTDPATGKYKYKFSDHPVGSGPYKFVRWSRDETIVLEAFDGYWGGPPGCAKVIFKTIRENDKRLLDVESGQASVMDGLAPQHVERVKKNPDLVFEEQPGMNIAYLSLNCGKKPFDDVRVRQAVAFALSKEKIRAAAYAGQGEIAVTPCPSTLPGHLKMEDRRQDVEKAKKLLADAGFPDGFDTVLWCMDNPRAYMPAPPQVATQIEQDLKRVGIRAKINIVEWKQYLVDTRNGKHDMCLLGWMSDYPDIDDFLYILLDKDNARPGSASNVSFYKGEKVHELLVKGRTTTDPQARWKLYAEAQQVLFDEVPMIPLMTMPEMRALRKTVKGYAIYPAGGEYLHDVSVGQ
jgi:peptide/nickel transport system substrate-binding protein